MDAAVKTQTSLPAPEAKAIPQARLNRSWRHRCPAGWRYAIAVLLVGLAWVTTFALRRSVDAPSFQTPFFVCAIVLSSWSGGFRPGIVATLLSIVLVEFTFTEPRYTIGFGLSEVPKFTVFFFTGAFISWLAQRQRRDEEALLVARASLEGKVRERTGDLEAANDRLTGEINERVRAQEELERLNRAWRVRSLFNRAVARSVDEHQLLGRVCESLVKVGRYPLTWIAFVQDNEIYPEAHAEGAGIDDLDRAWVRGGHGYCLAVKAIETGMPNTCLRRTRSPDQPADDWAERHSIRAVVALPLIADGVVIGSLMVYSDELEAFDAKETELLHQAANDVAQGIMLFRARAARALAESSLAQTQAELTRVARVTTMGELAASIAHEINQPLAAVITNANASLRWLDREPANLDEAREALRRIIRDGKSGSDVIARIRAMVKKDDVVRELVAINDVMAEILALTGGKLEGITLVTELAPDLPPVPADRVQIQQVLLNLVLNAVDAMESIMDRPRELHIETRRIESHIEISVLDSGVGLTPEAIERIFRAFHTTKPDGLGMGLSICRSIVELHGGRLWAEANSGHGAAFRFTIPMEAMS